MTKGAQSREATVRTGAGHAAFIGVMIGASALTFLRITTVALLLPISDFALYATVVATGAFLAGPLSFGAVEGTIKDFPRLVADGRQASMLVDARAIMGLTASRALAFAAPLLAAGFLLDVEWARLGGIALLVALGNAIAGVVASMQRAAGSPVTLASGTVLRAGLMQERGAGVPEVAPAAEVVVEAPSTQEREVGRFVPTLPPRPGARVTAPAVQHAQLAGFEEGHESRHRPQSIGPEPRPGNARQRGPARSLSRGAPA